MKSIPAVITFVVLAGTGVALAWWQTAPPEPPAASSSAAARDDAASASTLQAGASVPREHAVSTPAASPSDTGAPVTPAAEPTPPAAAASTADPVAMVTWPVAHPSPRAATAKGTAGGTPAVTPEIARKALRYVGADREAEKTWQRAIDDPAMPADVRSDLIEDLNENGFTDNSHPTAADLPLIEARLTLIERLAPYAIDDVNAAAFEEAYKDLLAMYVRLGGKPRPAANRATSGR